MRRFRTVLAYLPRHRFAITFGVLSIIIGQALQNYAPQLLRSGLAEIETATVAGRGIDREVVLHFALAYMWIMVARAFFLWSMRFYTVSASRKVEADMRLDFYRHLQTLDPLFFTRNRTGDLMSRATGDLEAVRSALGPAVMYIVNSICSLPMALGFMFAMDWVLTLISLVPLVFIALIVHWMAPGIMNTSRRAQDVMGKLSTVAQEDFAGVRVVKAYAKESFEEARFDVEAREYVDANLELARIRGLMSGGIHSLGAAGILVVLAYCGFSLLGYSILGRKIDLATLIAFQAYQINLVWPMMAFGWVLAMFQRGAAALERIDAILATKTAIADPESPAAIDELPGSISVRNLNFSFDESRLVLAGIDIELPGGRTLGIVGPTGSGKSTLAALLVRTYPVERGRVFHGEHDVNDVPLEVLRRGVAVVPQEAFLFSQTIGDNIAFGLREVEVPAERVERAARIAALHGDVSEFKHGYATRVGERGVTLSGGQKQRVAIARAVICEPRVLILDDCLSAVDARTEREILAGLEEVIAGRTTIIISHRLSAVMHSSEIVVLEEGQIVARGTHEELLTRRGYYAETWRRQQIEAELGEID